MVVLAIHRHESATGAHVSPTWNSLPPPSPPHPSGLSQSTGYECPASCLELALVIHFTYGNGRVSMLFSQTIPPSPFPTESKSLLFTSVSCCLVYRIIIIVFLNSIYMHLCSVFVFFFLTYLTLFNRLQFHPPHQNWLKCVPFYSWVIFHCVTHFFKGLLVLLGKIIYDEISSCAFTSVDPKEARTSTGKSEQNVILPRNAIRFHF